MSFRDWIELESDPGLFSLLLEDFGVTDTEVIEVYDLSKPIDCHVYGFIFLFKWTEERKSRRKNIELEENFVFDEKVVNDMFFAQQIIPDSCASHALLSVLLNIPDIQLGLTLTQLRDTSRGFDPETKGYAIGNYWDICVAHNNHGKQELRLPAERIKNITAASRAMEAFHYVSYIPYQGRLYELDGLKPYPIDHGPWGTGESWTDKTRRVIQDRILQATGGDYSHDIRYNLMAVVTEKRQMYKRKIDVLEHNKKVLIEVFKKLANKESFVSNPQKTGILKSKSDASSLSAPIKRKSDAMSTEEDPLSPKKVSFHSRPSSPLSSLSASSTITGIESPTHPFSDSEDSSVETYRVKSILRGEMKGPVYVYGEITEETSFKSEDDDSVMTDSNTIIAPQIEGSTSVTTKDSLSPDISISYSAPETGDAMVDDKCSGKVEALPENNFPNSQDNMSTVPSKQEEGNRAVSDVNLPIDPTLSSCEERSSKKRRLSADLTLSSLLVNKDDKVELASVEQNKAVETSDRPQTLSISGSTDVPESPTKNIKLTIKLTPKGDNASTEFKVVNNESDSLDGNSENTNVAERNVEKSDSDGDRSDTPSKSDGSGGDSTSNETTPETKEEGQKSQNSPDENDSNDATTINSTDKISAGNNETKEQPRVPSLKISLPLKSARPKSLSDQMDQASSGSEVSPDVDIETVDLLNSGVNSESSSTNNSGRTSASSSTNASEQTMEVFDKLKGEPETLENVLKMMTVKRGSVDNLLKYEDEITLSSLQVAMQNVDENCKSCHACYKEEMEKFEKYKIDDCRRRHNYDPFISTFLTMLAEQGHMAALLEEQTMLSKRPSSAWTKSVKKDVKTKKGKKKTAKKAGLKKK